MKTFQIEISTKETEDTILLFLNADLVTRSKGYKNIIECDGKRILFSHPVISITEVDYMKQDAYSDLYPE